MMIFSMLLGFWVGLWWYSWPSSRKSTDVWAPRKTPDHPRYVR